MIWRNVRVSYTVNLPIDNKEIILADRQAVYIEGYNICLI